MKNDILLYIGMFFLLLFILIILNGCHELEKNPELIKDSEKVLEEVIQDAIQEHEHHK